MAALLRSVVLILSILLLAAGGPAFAARRLALVIGNDAYPNLGTAQQLLNAVSDARAMRRTLEGLGFEVMEGENLSRGDIIDKLSDFAARLQPDDLAFFFFAGHGVALGGQNYIVPSDMPVPRAAGLGEEQRLADRAVAETTITTRVTQAQIAVVVLDSCRNNPFTVATGRAIGAGRGLVRPPETEGVLSIYSAGIGQEALDRLGTDDPSPDSVFTRVFIEKLRQPGVGLREAAFQTQGEVARLARQAGAAQVPGVYSQILGEDVVLSAPVKLPVEPAAPSATVLPPAPLPPLVSEPQDFAMAMDQDTIAALDDFLTQHPTGHRADRARQERERLVLLLRPAPLAPVVARRCNGVTQASLRERTAGQLTADEACALRPKDEFKECTDCPTMVLVPSGSFTMGSPASEKERGTDEGPRHRLSFAEPFAVGKFAVTFDEWDACVADGGCNGYRPGDQGWGRGLRPVINVSWDDAQAYVKWLGRKTQKPYRLLSEAEWEYAARAGTTTIFWWGDSISTRQANYDGTSTYNGSPKGEYRQKTLPVDSFAPNPWGLYNMLGNVWQWTQDCYQNSYAGAPPDGAAFTTGDCKYRVLRGGSWYNYPRILRAAFRLWSIPDNRYFILGFRVALASPITP